MKFEFPIMKEIDNDGDYSTLIIIIANVMVAYPYKIELMTLPIYVEMD